MIVFLFTGVFVKPLITRFSYRQIIIVCCVVSASGFAISGVSPSIYLLYFTYGFMTGE